MKEEKPLRQYKLLSIYMLLKRKANKQKQPQKKRKNAAHTYHYQRVEHQ